MAESVESELANKFLAATEYLPKVASSLKQEELLNFYAFYKQAVIGKCNIPRPNWYMTEAKRKWDAWNHLGDMCKEEAMNRYIKLLSEAFPDWDEKKQNHSWVSVSCFANDEVQLEEFEKDIFDNVKDGNVEEVKRFSQTNNIDIVDEEGMGLLHWASDRGNTEMVKCLIDLNTNLDLKDNSGQTPLHYACSCGYIDIVKILLDKGANPNIRCDSGFRPVDIVTEDSIRSLMESISI